MAARLLVFHWMYRVSLPDFATNCCEMRPVILGNKIPKRCAITKGNWVASCVLSLSPLNLDLRSPRFPPKEATCETL